MYKRFWKKKEKLAANSRKKIFNRGHKNKKKEMAPGHSPTPRLSNMSELGAKTTGDPAVKSSKIPKREMERYYYPATMYSKNQQKKNVTLDRNDDLAGKLKYWERKLTVTDSK